MASELCKNKDRKTLPAIQIILKHIQTQGDMDQVLSLTQVGGQEIFTKTIEKALIENNIDWKCK